MSLHDRKMNLIQEFLKISDEELIEKFENLLKTVHAEKLEINPMSMNEFFTMIEKSEDDIRNGKVTEAADLLNKIDEWQ